MTVKTHTSDVHECGGRLFPYGVRDERLASIFTYGVEHPPFDAEPLTFNPPFIQIMAQHLLGGWDMRYGDEFLFEVEEDARWFDEWRHTADDFANVTMFPEHWTKD